MSPMVALSACPGRREVVVWASHWRNGRSKKAIGLTKVAHQSAVRAQHGPCCSHTKGRFSDIRRPHGGLVYSLGRRGRSVVAAVDVRAWMSNYSSLFYMNVVSYPCSWLLLILSCHCIRRSSVNKWNLMNYSDIMMDAMTSEITGVSIVHSIGWLFRRIFRRRHRAQRKQYPIYKWS